MDLPPILLDREVQRAAGIARRAREELARGDQEEAPRGSPLSDERRVSSRDTYLELTEAEAKGDPLIPGLRAWVRVLTLERVLWPDAVRLAAAWREVSIELEEPERARMSPREVLGRLLADRAAARRRAWAEALSRGSRGVSDAARIFAERRAEATRLLGAPDADEIEVPMSAPEALGAIAARLLEATTPMADLMESEPWEEAIDRGMARGATSGWPARLSARWVEELFRSTRLTEGLAIRIGELPEPLGAASFVRTLTAFGRSFAEASAPASAPFVLAHPPFDLRVARRAALFGGLLADPEFGVRAIGLGRDRAREQAREIARAVLQWLRLEAARVKLRGALLLPARERKERFEEETARALGAPIPASLAGALPKLSPADPTRLLGALMAATDRRGLIERFDEDWFRNPHAARALREEQSVLPASPRATEEDLERGLHDLTRALEASIG